MLSQTDPIHILKTGGIEFYVMKTPEYNPYTKSERCDWHFELERSGFNLY